MSPVSFGGCEKSIILPAVIAVACPGMSYLLGVGEGVGTMAALIALRGKVAGADKLNVLGDVGKAAAGGFLKKFTATQGGQAISKATGQILNPHKAVVYQGPCLLYTSPSPRD